MFDKHITKSMFFIVGGFVLLKILLPMVGLAHFYHLVGGTDERVRYVRDFLEDLTLILLIVFIYYLIG